MCAGAIVQARVPRLVYAADDPKGGAFRTCFEILSQSQTESSGRSHARRLGERSHFPSPVLLCRAPVGLPLEIWLCLAHFD